MALSARLTSRLHAHLLPALGAAAYGGSPAAVGWPPGARLTSGGGSGGSSPSDAKQRAAQYVREKEHRQQAAQQADDSSSSSGDGPRSRLAEAAAEWSEGQQALFLSSPSGLGVGAEAAITQAIKDGALDNLKGKGKPLPAEDHSAQFGRVDPLVAAVTRTMGAQGVKPLSLELRDEVRREFAALRQQLDQELRAALETPSSLTNQASSSNASSRGGGGWVSSWFGSSGSAAASAPADSQRHTVAGIRAGQHPALQHAVEELRRLITEYNNACLADKEAFGAFWPLDRMKQLDWEAEVEAALERIGSGSSGGGSGGSRGGSD